MSVGGATREESASWISWPGALLPALGASGFAFQNAALNVSLPFAARDLGVGITDVSLIVLSYFLTIGATLITSGRLGDLLGSRRMFLVGVAVYLGASVLCGLAPNLPVLLALRVVQGVGASLGISNEIALAARAASPGRRGQAVGITWGLANFGQLAGLFLGGFIVDAFGWRAVFWANLVIMLAVLSFGWRGTRPDQPITRPEGVGWRQLLDPAGAMLFAGAMVALLTALNRGPSWGFGSPPTLALFAAAVVLAVGLYGQEGRAVSPMLHLDLFRNRVFTAAVGGALANYVTFMGLTFIAPFYLAEQQGLTAAQAGLVLAPMGVTTVAVAYGAGWLADRTGPRPLEIVGLLSMAGALGALLLLGTPSVVQVGLCLVVAGFGTSLISVPNTQAVIAAVPAAQIGLVGGMVHAVRYVGTMGGVALAGAISTLAGAGAAFSTTYVALAGFALLGVGITWARGRSAKRSAAA